MKTLSSIILSLGICVGVLAQTPYINERYHYRLGAIISSIAVSDSNYYVACRDNANPELYRYTRINEKGIITDSLKLNYSDSLISIGSYSNCLQVRNGLLYDAYSKTEIRNGLRSWSIVLSKIYLDLKDTIETKEFSIPEFRCLSY